MIYGSWIHGGFWCRSTTMWYTYRSLNCFWNLPKCPTFSRKSLIIQNDKHLTRYQNPLSSRPFVTNFPSLFHSLSSSIWDTTNKMNFLSFRKVNMSVYIVFFLMIQIPTCTILINILISLYTWGTGESWKEAFSSFMWTPSSGIIGLFA